MKRLSNTMIRGLRLVVPALALLFTQQAFAVGTPAGTTVSNTADVSYNVNGQAQTPVTSLAADFTVDRLVQFTLVPDDASSTSVNPGETGAVTTFTLTNIGNAPMDADLAAANFAGAANGIPDIFDVSNFTIYVDNAGDTSLDLNEDAFVDELPDTAGLNSVTIWVTADVPNNGIANGEGASIELTATPHDAGAAGLGALTVNDGGADVIGGAAQVVLATASLASQDGYVVSSAIIGVTKASEVIDDPINSTTNPKAIPGATIEYEITATNTGPQDATGVGFIDTPDPLTLSVALGQLGGGADAEVEQNGSVIYSCSLDANDGNGDGCGIFTGEVRIIPTSPVTLGGTISGTPNSAIARFRVTIL